MQGLKTDSKSHLAKTPDNFLQEAERENKKMYLETCLQQRRHLSPFIASVNRLLGVDATDPMKRIASCLATKWR